jgi:hypothetical protein
MVSRLQLLATLAICCACNPGPLELVGLRCNAERPCGDGLACLDGVCDTPVDGGTDAGDAGVDAGAVIPVDTNLLVNPGFETKPLLDGGTVGWRPASGVLVWLDGGFAGAHSARLEAGASQPSLVPANATPGTTIGMLFCASLWVRSDSDAGGGDLTLVIRERLEDGGTQNSSSSRLNAPRTAWKRLTEDYVAFGSGAVDIRLVASRLDAGEGLTLDDVSLIRAGGPSCPP